MALLWSWRKRKRLKLENCLSQWLKIAQKVSILRNTITKSVLSLKHAFTKACAQKLLFALNETFCDNFNLCGLPKWESLKRLLIWKVDALLRRCRFRKSRLVENENEDNLNFLLFSSFSFTVAKLNFPHWEIFFFSFQFLSVIF